MAFSNADAVTGDYELSVPEGVARVAPFGQALANGAHGGLYTVSATVGATTLTAAVDVNGANGVVDVGP